MKNHFNNLIRCVFFLMLSSQCDASIRAEVSVNRSQHHIVFTEVNGLEKFSAVFYQEYILYLQNNSAERVVLEKWVLRGKYQDPANTKSQQAYSNLIVEPRLTRIDNGVGNKNKRITIAAKSRVKLKLEVPVFIPNSVWSFLDESFSFEQKYNYFDTELVSTKFGYPKFGQFQLKKLDVIDYVDQGEKSRFIEYEDGDFQQDFWLCLVLTKFNILNLYIPPASQGIAFSSEKKNASCSR